MHRSRGRTLEILAVALVVLGSGLSGQDRPEKVPPAASERVEELRRLVAARKFAEAWRLEASVREALEAPGVASGLRAEAEGLLRRAGLEAVGVIAAWRGRTSGTAKELVEVVYDCERPGWDADFEIVPVLPTALGARRQGRTIEGTGGFLHRAIWQPELRIEITGRALAPHDHGPVFLDPDVAFDEESFLVGFHDNRFFGVKYDETRSVSGGHVLVLAGRRAESRARAHRTQLLASRAVPVIELGREFVSSLALAKGRVTFTTGTTASAFTLVRETQVFERLRAGLLLRASAFEVRRIVLAGKLDPRWLEEETQRQREAESGHPR
jgi:hypothetical protein